MADILNTPGVYIQEVPSGDRPIEAVGASTAGFVGRAPNPNAAKNIAVAINSWADFVRRYMSPDPTVTEDAALLSAVDTAQAELTNAIKAKNTQSASAATSASALKAAQQTVQDKRQALKTATDALQYQATYLSDAVYGYFLNGGVRCWIVNLGEQVSVTGQDAKVEPPISAFGGTTKVGLDILEKVDEVAIVAAPGYTDAASYDAIRSHCDLLRDRVGILDGPSEITDVNGVMDLLGGQEPTEAATWTMPFKSEYGQLTMYVPWIRVANPDAASGSSNGNGSSNGHNGSQPATKLVPPSGHIAGIWARSDFTRGVHKAPANEPVRGALDLQRQITQVEQSKLNENGVNVIRYFANEGILVWGARTLNADKSAFKYLNIRRLFNVIEESIADSTRWIVFEPNDRPLWQSIKRDVTAFLMGYWRDGALMGRTPEEAFFVKCDEGNNPMDSIKLGRVVIEVGLAPVYPAEFVIFKISQYEAKTEVEVQPA